MASQLNIVAVAAGGWSDRAEINSHLSSLRNSIRPGFQIVNGYQTYHDLSNRIQQLIDNDSDNPCIAVLEIYHHGTPVSADNMNRNNVSAWGGALMGLRSWCDEAKIFLSACNTGLTDPSRTRGSPGPIAQLLANAMPFNPGGFAHKIRVYGAAGYITGSHAGANENSKASYSTGALWWSIDHPPYPNSRSGTTGNAWNEFKNGTW